jgi:hypothetical protein
MEARERPGAPQLVSVAQLTEIVSNLKRKHDWEGAKEIVHLQLTERLSSPNLSRLSGELPGAKSRSALISVGDESVFLEPPKAEIPKKAEPEKAERRQMMSLVVEYLKKVIPKLPNFYAKRITTSYESTWTKNEKAFRSALHPAGKFRATVYYRGSKEVVHAEGAEENGLITRGTFGPILSTVIVDAANSNTTRWSRWEEGPNGSMAVFKFMVPKAESHYQVSGGAGLGLIGPSAYHGEIGIDPGSGAILRLVLEADPDLGSSQERADVMVEYGSVAIGGETYTCPVRSVSYSVGGLIVAGELSADPSQEASRLNDVVFDDYHVFRSEMRIVP